jgi:methylated-DNA-protein-cysteine methyltransferase related protein
MTEPNFFDKVFKITSKVPFGRVTSYGAIARYLGSPQAARMVGWALNTSHSQPCSIPAHRVVNRQGILSGKHHFYGPNVMKHLLENEGVVVIDDKVVHFNKIFWDPSKEISSDAS